MLIIDPYLNPSSYKKIIARYGGEYGLIEKIRIGGTGSPKLIYDYGIEAFDEIDEAFGAEIPFVNFELLKNGLILRLNKKQQLGVGLLHFDEIAWIKLEGYRILLRRSKMSDRIVYAGDLIISLKEAEALFLKIPVREFEATKKYFGKKAFLPFFDFKISESEPLIDNNGTLLDRLRGF